jgi:asparagine synthase (glutamine-hydrolysing)
MSGIAVVANADGRPVDRELMAAMAEALRIRGPDAHTVWTDGGPIGLVHTLFQTTEDDVPLPQPFSFDGVTWITADARIDARDELIDRLRGHGRQIEHTACDAELILHAWHVWDSACVEHLLGDFSFALVDTSKHRVFAARDQLGVKPMFYARVGGGLVLTNDLDCARLHPRVSDTLDDSWVCDFLLFGRNTDVTASVFRDIRRLPGGHRLDWTPAGLIIARYWSITIPEEVWLKHPNDYVERFNEVFEKAVADRLRTRRVSMELTGGLDSTTIAATARRWTQKHAPDTDFRGLTCVWDPVLPNDREREFATEAAQFLGLPLAFIEGRDHAFFDEAWYSAETQSPEPNLRGCRIIETQIRLAARHSRVLLSGNGGDEALPSHPRYYTQLLSERRYGRWLADVWRHLYWQRQLPPIGLRTAIRSILRMRPAEKDWSLDFPKWMPNDLIQKLNLRDRWNQFWHSRPTGNSRTPGGYSIIATYLLDGSMGFYNISSLRGPVEYRFPWLDLRVIQLCWSFPPVPIRFAKHLVRVAMRDQLPTSLLRRRKTALAGEPLIASGCKPALSWIQHVAAAPIVTRYVSADPIDDFQRGVATSEAAWMLTRALELGSWLHHRLPSVD